MSCPAALAATASDIPARPGPTNTILIVSSDGAVYCPTDRRDAIDACDGSTGDPQGIWGAVPLWQRFATWETVGMDTKALSKPGSPILIGISVVVVLALLVTLALTDRNVRSYDPGTPEATAQAYIQALFDEDRAAAHGYLSSDLQDKCEPYDLELWWVRGAESASFDEVRIDGEHAEIELRLLSTDFELGIFPFDNYDYSRETELELDRVAGEWVITNATWPLAGCTWR